MDCSATCRRLLCCADIFCVPSSRLQADLETARAELEQLQQSSIANEARLTMTVDRLKKRLTIQSKRIGGCAGLFLLLPSRMVWLVAQLLKCMPSCEKNA